MKLPYPGGLCAVGLLATLMIGCDADRRNAAPTPGTAADRGSWRDSAIAITQSDGAGSEPAILFMGTSLTAGLGIPLDQSYPLVIGGMIDESGLPFRVVNAGVSGETSAGAARRIDWLLEQPFEILVLETGANDMLRGTPPAEVERNIQAIVDGVRARRPDARILLAGMRAAPNLGPEYVEEFEAVFPRLADRNDLELIPFLLEGVAAEPELNLGDGMHPNAAGQRRVAENVWAVLGPIAAEVAAELGAEAEEAAVGSID